MINFEDPEMNPDMQVAYEFKYALACMQRGMAIKRSHWLGYWKRGKELPNGETEVEMHCKDGSVVFMSQGCAPMMTLENVVANDWIVLHNQEIAELDAIHQTKILASKRVDD